MMAIITIPQSYKYICDSCGKSHLQQNASGHYTDSRPPHWARLTIAQHAYDFQGAAVADGTISKLLCEYCTGLISEAINRVVAYPEQKSNGSS